jgi:predicted methyltransferase
MSYDPTKPVDDSLATAGELRDQFNALKSLIDAQQATIDAQQATINDNSVMIGDLLNAFNNYVASHP